MILVVPPKVTGETLAAMNHGVRLIHLTFDAASKIDVTDVPNMLINGGFRITQFAEEAVNLETAFMRLTKGMVQ